MSTPKRLAICSGCSSQTAKNTTLDCFASFQEIWSSRRSETARCPRLPEFFETDKPFLALLHDREPSEGATLHGYFEKLNSVYLINPTNDEIRVTVSTSGFFSVDEIGVLVAPPKVSGKWTVPSRTYVCIENPSDDELDEVYCSWSIVIESSSGRIIRAFSAGKRREDTMFCQDIPYLRKPGLLISQR